MQIGMETIANALGFGIGIGDSSYAAAKAAAANMQAQAAGSATLSRAYQQAMMSQSLASQSVVMSQAGTLHLGAKPPDTPEPTMHDTWAKDTTDDSPGKNICTSTTINGDALRSNGISTSDLLSICSLYEPTKGNYSFAEPGYQYLTLGRSISIAYIAYKVPSNIKYSEVVATSNALDLYLAYFKICNTVTIQGKANTNMYDSIRLTHNIPWTVTNRSGHTTFECGIKGIDTLMTAITYGRMEQAHQ